MDAKIEQALKNLAALHRQEQHEDEVDFVVSSAQTELIEQGLPGVVLAVPPELAVARLLGMYDTLTLAKHVQGGADVEARYEVVARIANDIIAICS